MHVHRGSSRAEQTIQSGPRVRCNLDGMPRESLVHANVYPRSACNVSCTGFTITSTTYDSEIHNH